MIYSYNILESSSLCTMENNGGKPHVSWEDDNSHNTHRKTHPYTHWKSMDVIQCIIPMETYGILGPLPTSGTTLSGQEVCPVDVLPAVVVQGRQRSWRGRGW